MKAAVVSATIAVVLFASAGAVGAPIELQASFHGCGDVPSANSYDVEAKRVSCSKAREVVRAYNAAANEGGGFTKDVGEYHCKVVGLYGDGGEQRCAARGHRVITFLRGG